MAARPRRSKSPIRLKKSWTTLHFTPPSTKPSPAKSPTPGPPAAPTTTPPSSPPPPPLPPPPKPTNPSKLPTPPPSPRPKTSNQQTQALAPARHTSPTRKRGTRQPKHSNLGDLSSSQVSRPRRNVRP